MLWLYFDELLNIMTKRKVQSWILAFKLHISTLALRHLRHVSY